MKNKYQIPHSLSLEPRVPISLNRKTLSLSLLLYAEYKQKLCDIPRTYVHIDRYKLVQPNVIRLICTSLSGLTIRVCVCFRESICCTHHWFKAYASIRFDRDDDSMVSAELQISFFYDSWACMNCYTVQMYRMYVIFGLPSIFVVALRAHTAPAIRYCWYCWVLLAGT